MSELALLMKRLNLIAANRDKVNFELKSYTEFEAYGRANETWDFVYEINIPGFERSFKSNYNEQHNPDLFIERVITTLRKEGYHV